MAIAVTNALHFAELPDILTPQDLIKYLPIGREASGAHRPGRQRVALPSG
jgi:hypothetical protein